MENADPEHASPQNGSDSEHESDPENGAGPKNRSGPGQAAGEQQGASQQGGESRHIENMEKPYHGPEEHGGISAHGIEGETDLRRAKQYAEMVVDTVREGLLVLNFDLCVEAANESFYRMFEVSPSETEGRLIYELGDGQWDIPKLRKLLEEILPDRKVLTGFEVTHEFEKVGRRVMRLNARQLDHHERILVAIEDITESDEAEKRLRASEEKLRELNRSLEKRVKKRTAELREQTERLRHLAVELASAEQRERKRLASLLHDDLQQLLYGAQMQLSRARGKTKTEAAHAAVENASDQIGKAVEAARDLTRQLRPPALYEAGLTPAFDWLASDMAERHGLEVTVDTEGIGLEDLGHPLSDDIKALLYTCARELLFNTVKYAGVEEASLRLCVDTSPADVSPADVDAGGSGTAETDRLRLVVEDEGRGFEVGRAFENYGFESSSEEGGFGLLSIRERIAALGGSTEIDSRPGEGTRVELALPLSAILSDDSGRQAAPAEASEGDPAEGGRAEGSGPEGPQATEMPAFREVQVVVADDHAVVREGIANLIAQDERTAVVGEAAGGHEATQLVEKEQPDAVLMDVNMPEMNGVEATREIRSCWPETKVVGMSVQADRATERSMLEAGADAFVPKSGDADQIIDAILQVTERSSQAGE